MKEDLDLVQTVIVTLADDVRQGSFREGLQRGTTIGWQRGGVLFATEVPSPEEREDDRRRSPLTVLTPHAAEAGWLLDRLLEVFLPLLDECIESDFFERLAEAALEYCAYVDPGDATDANLLKIILSEAEGILEEMRTGEFPYVP